MCYDENLPSWKQRDLSGAFQFDHINIYISSVNMLLENHLMTPGHPFRVYNTM